MMTSARTASWCLPLSLSTSKTPPVSEAFDFTQVGQKAWNLARLAAAGLPVPPAFAVSAQALVQHLHDRQGLRAEVDGIVASLNRGDLQGGEAFARAEVRIADLIVGAPMPLDVVDAVLTWRHAALPGTLIVRSSAIGEDGADASFAGQLDSFAGVDGDEELLLAIRRCWASAWSARSLFYQMARHRPLGGVGVVVQALVEARVSGVLFTRAPGSDADMHGEFCFGPGEALVSGRITPGTMHAPRDVNAHGAGGVIASWPDQPEARVTFDVAQVVGLGRRIEAMSDGVPQDIEWCIDATGDLQVVQTRPITAAAPSSKPSSSSLFPRRAVRFSNANVNENFPVPISPFLYSIARKGYAAYFRNLGTLMGLDESRVAAAAPALSSIVGAHGARLYYNLSSLHGCLRLAPFGEWLISSFNLFVGVDGGAAESSRLLPPRSLLEESREALRFVVRGTMALARASRRLPTFEREVDAFAAAAHPTLVPHLDDDALEHLMRWFLDIREHRWGPAALGDVSAMIGYGALRSFLGRTMPEAAEPLQNELLKGLSDVVSGIPTQLLWDLGQQKRNGDAHFETNLAWFLEAWGFRRSGELLLTVPTFQEDPTPVLALIEQLGGVEGKSPREITEGHARSREAKTEAVLSSTSLVLRPALRGLLRFTRNAIGLRERARLKQALLYTRLRPVVLELGARLHGRALVERPDDIFMLSIDEVLDHLAGVSMFGAFVGEICTQRRDQHGRLTTSVPPDAFAIERGSYLGTASLAEPDPIPAKASEGAAAMTGTPAAAGHARGRAAVLADVVEAARMTRGDILVTKQTDPGWGPVLFLARALVIERGGMLSHGAIIAREFGVPCVVGVARASSRIAHGTVLDVDGDRGIVTDLGIDGGAASGPREMAP
jgi:phosphohistidine swiveling domain-containing protein